jgi:predicted metalloprotease with PDZ domain
MLLSGRAPSKVAALSRLSVPLTHELFHLWVPNALALEGDYDWFYEGFTMYQAMRAAGRLNLLTFEDFLNSIGRVFDAYAFSSVGPAHPRSFITRECWSRSSTI